MVISIENLRFMLVINANSLIMSCFQLLLSSANSLSRLLGVQGLRAAVLWTTGPAGRDGDARLIYLPSLTASGTGAVFGIRSQLGRISSV